MHSLFSALPLPYSIYAHALQLAEGKVIALHYGLEPQRDNLHTAQHRATDYLLKHLPPAPAKLLQLSPVFGYTASRLQQAGYDYTGLVATENQLTLAQTHCPDANFVVDALDKYATVTEYDCIVLQEAGHQRLNAEARLQHAARLLRSKGQFIIIDEVETDKLSGLLQLAQQYGFHITQQADLTARAAPTLSYLIDLLYQQRTALLRPETITSLQLTELLYRLELRRQQYVHKQLAYMHFCLQRAT